MGKSKVFLRAGQMAEMDARRAEVLAKAAKLIQRQIRTHLTRKEFITLRKATIYIQKMWRGDLSSQYCNFRHVLLGIVQYKPNMSPLFLNCIIVDTVLEITGVILLMAFIFQLNLHVNSTNI